MENIKTDLIETIEGSEERVTKNYSIEISTLRKDMADDFETLNKKRSEFQDKFQTKVAKIKEICSTYFEKYDKDLVGV